LWELQSEGLVIKTGKKYCSAKRGNEHLGILHIDDSGQGTIKSDSTKKILIDQKNLQHADDGDKVKFVIIDANNHKGKITEVIEPVGKLIRGKVLQKGTHFLILPIKPFSKKVIIKNRFLESAIPGDVVESKITKIDKDSFQVKIIKILSREFSSDISYYNLYKEYSLSEAFSIEIENEINQYSEDTIETEIKNRLDLREELIFTIDPDDAKDYDDAVSLQVVTDGSFKLGVHIADVSFFVPEKSFTDIEAFTRGTSIYMPGKSIPMLPHKLTNSICSLVENKNRLTFSIIINLSAEAELLSYSLHKSVIKSKKRLTYGDANELIKNYAKSKNENDHLSKSLSQMNELAKQLAQKRKEKGSIDFDSAEPHFELDNNGNVLSITAREMLDSNHLIEEFMLLANRLVTDSISSIKPELPFIYRVHDQPPADKINELRKILKYFGYAIKRTKKINPKMYQTILENIKNDKNKFLLNDTIIRSMAKAVYSVKNIGHFGLGFDLYTHFTSPIRRYPDLVVHRLLEKYILNKQHTPVSIEKLSRIAVSSSEAERCAMEIEREAIKIKQIQFLSNQPEKIYNAVIANIVDFGFFIEIHELFLGGLVHIKNLEDDYYIYEPDKYRIVGKRTKKIYKLGDEIKVKISDLDLRRRRIDFTIPL